MADERWPWLPWKVWNRKCAQESGSPRENTKEQILNQEASISCQNSVPMYYFASDHHEGMFGTILLKERSVYSIVTRFCTNGRTVLCLETFYALKVFVHGIHL